MNRKRDTTTAPQRHAGLRLPTPAQRPADEFCAAACDLDREADLELSAGRHDRAELLAHRAAEIRGGL